MRGKSTNTAGVFGESDNFSGIFGVCHNHLGGGVTGANDKGGFGVIGESDSGTGVRGASQLADGVLGIGRRGVVGKSVDNAGVVGESENFHAVFGISHSAHNGGVFGANDAGNGAGFGVIGTCDSHIGVAGDSKTGTGVRGQSDTWRGVFGHSRANAGVVGESEEFDGVWGMSKKAEAAGVSGHNAAGGLAGFFEGDVEVTGDIRLNNGDCAEDFDVSGADKVEPGTVMVFGNEGALSESQQAYDKRVAGVISGAGDYKPGIVLDKRQTSGNRQPVALMGKVFCKVDAQFGAIEVGDLLTTSPTPGHAMKTSDPFKAFGAVIGKALRPLTGGQGLIPILIALQ